MITKKPSKIKTNKNNKTKVTVAAKYDSPHVHTNL